MQLLNNHNVIWLMNINCNHLSRMNWRRLSQCSEFRLIKTIYIVGGGGGGEMVMASEPPINIWSKWLIPLRGRVYLSD